MIETLSTNDVIADIGYSPAGEESDAIAIDYILERLINRYRWIAPAVVDEYDREKNIVTIIPGLKDTTTGESIELCKLEVPCYIAGGGGWVSSYPLKAGDVGWLCTCDRDISNFLKDKKVSEPNTLRRHDLADSFFIPDVISGCKFNKENEQAAVFQNIKGDIQIATDEKSMRLKFMDKFKITIEKGQMLIEAGKSKVTINDGGVLIESDQSTIKSKNINLTGEVKIDGGLQVTKSAAFDSNIKASGNIEASEVTASGKSLSSHTHSTPHGMSGSPN